MKQDVAVISLDAYAGQFYAQQVQELFGERITVCSYSVRDGSIEHMPRRYDLYMVTTDAFDSLGDLHQYVPIDGEMMEIHVTLRWDVVRRLQSLPAGKRALFVNLSDKMCREAVTRLNQLGVNQLVFDLYHPGAPEPDMGQYDFVITPQETRYVPAGAKAIIDIGQRVCDSSTMIEAALRLGLEELLESERFEQYQREVATNTYSFDRVFARGLRLESQFEMLMEILDEGIVGVNERGEVFACNRKLEEITGIPCGEALHRPAGAVYPFLPFARCLKEKAPQPARVVSAGGVNINVAVAPVLRGDACIGAFATVQRFNDAENRQNELSPPCRCSSSARRALARSCLPTRCTTPPHAPAGPSWPSTAPPCRKTCWRASCSATRRGPSPAPGRGASRGCLSLPTGAPSSWTRWRA